MPKLFLFAIGGSGARVVKALSFLLAGGAEARTERIIPIIIDPDRTNGNLTGTLSVLEDYEALHGMTQPGSSEFFHTPVSPLVSAASTKEPGAATGVSTGYKSEIAGTDVGRFNSFVAYDRLPPASKKMMQLLYSPENLKEPLNVGFKGRPNMGAIVLNKYKDSEDFKYFANKFSEGDRIFIISSIFGGTGSAGFPLLVNNLRNANQIKLANAAFLSEATIGAITLQPYFGIEEKAESAIHKSTFAGKTRAALTYYHRELNDKLNALYYIGDTQVKDYPNNEGGETQSNPAHYIELLAASAILDFLATEDANLPTGSTAYKEFGIRNGEGKLSLKSMSTPQSSLYLPLIRFAYASKYWEEQLHKAAGHQAWTKRGGREFGKKFMQGTFYSTLKRYTAAWKAWYREMSSNEKAFAPFVFDAPLHQYLTGIEHRKKGIFKLRKWDYGDFDTYLNGAEENLIATDAPARFSELFSNVTREIYSDRIQ